LVQRAAKLHRKGGGGSLTLLLVLPGSPATGRTQRKPDMAKYKHISPELKAKMEAALRSKSDRPGGASTGALRTEVISFNMDWEGEKQDAHLAPRGLQRRGRSDMI
jgi:hypothetical protein